MSCARIAELAPLVKAAVWQIAVRNHNFFLDIHAGVVGDGRQCILFPAPPGHGKSMLTAALSKAGMQYFSDEVALIEGGSFHVSPTPLAICVKSTGWTAMSRLFPELSNLRVHHRSDGKDVRYLPPPPPVAIPAEGLPARVIVFPSYDPDVVSDLRPVGKGDALKRLLNQCLIVSTPLHVEQVASLVRLIKAVACYDMATSSLDDAVALVRALVD